MEAKNAALLMAGSWLEAKTAVLLLKATTDDKFDANLDVLDA